MPTVPSSPSSFTLTISAGTVQSNSQSVTFNIPAGVWNSVTWVSVGTVSSTIALQTANGGTWICITAEGASGNYNFSTLFTTGEVLDAVNAAAGSQLSANVYDNIGSPVGTNIVDSVSSYYLILDGGSSTSASSLSSTGSAWSSSSRTSSATSATSAGSSASRQSSTSAGSQGSSGSRTSSLASATSGSSVGQSPPPDGPPICDALNLPLPNSPLLFAMGTGMAAGEPNLGNSPLVTGALRVGPEWSRYPDYGDLSVMYTGQLASLCGNPSSSCGVPSNGPSPLVPL